MNENIMKTPATVAEFVTFKEDLKMVHSREDEIETRFEEINDMFTLINSQS